MLTIKSLEETKQLLSEGKIQRSVFDFIIDNLSLVKSYVEEHGNESFADDFMWCFGGYFHVLEEESDLGKISVTDMDWIDRERWPTLLETSGTFDACEWLPDGSYVYIFEVTNNSGGHSYLIPRNLVTDNVVKSINKTL